MLWALLLPWCGAGAEAEGVTVKSYTRIRTSRGHRGVALNGNGSLVAVGGHGYGEVYDTATGKLMRAFRGSGACDGKDFVNWMAFSADGSLVATSSSTSCCVYDVTSGEAVFSFVAEKENDLFWVRFHPSLPLLVTGGFEKATVFDARSWKNLVNVTQNMQLMSFSADGARLVGPASTGGFLVVDIATGEERVMARDVCGVTSPCLDGLLSDNGKYILLGNAILDLNGTAVGAIEGTTVAHAETRRHLLSVLLGWGPVDLFNTTGPPPWPLVATVGGSDIWMTSLSEDASTVVTIGNDPGDPVLVYKIDCPFCSAPAPVEGTLPSSNGTQTRGSNATHTGGSAFPVAAVSIGAAVLVAVVLGVVVMVLRRRRGPADAPPRNPEGHRVSVATLCGDGPAGVSPDGGLDEPAGHVGARTLRGASRSRQRGDGMQLPEGSSDYSPATVLLRQELGRGAAGSVYLGIHSCTQQHLAVKKFKASEGLHGELRILQKMSHAHIVALRGFHVEHGDGGAAYLYMEYVPGGSLADVVAHQGRLYERCIRRLMRGAVAGVAYLHAEGVVHRDLKPHNLLVDVTGVVKVADFGACTEHNDMDAVATVSGMRGTPAFMAPEAVQKKVCTASDVWSLGATVVHLASGERPWSETGDMGVFGLVMHIGQGVGKPGHHPAIPQLSPDGRRVVAACFEAHPQARPRCAALLADPFFTGLDADLAGCESYDEYSAGSPRYSQPAPSSSFDLMIANSVSISAAASSVVVPAARVPD